jgi:hypothetical protein
MDGEQLVLSMIISKSLKKDKQGLKGILKYLVK